MQSLYLLSSMLQNRAILTYRQGGVAYLSAFSHTQKTEYYKKSYCPKGTIFQFTLRVTPKLKLLFIALASCLMPKKQTHFCSQPTQAQMYRR